MQALTWSDPKYVLLVQNRIQPKNVHYFSYADYKEGRETEITTSDTRQGAFFNLMEQQSKNDCHFVSKFIRGIGEEYTSQVFVSLDQCFAAIKRKPDKTDAEDARFHSFDIFKGLNTLEFFAKGPSFTEPKDVLQREYSEEYVATI